MMMPKKIKIATESPREAYPGMIVCKLTFSEAESALLEQQM